MTLLERILEMDFMPHGHCYLWRPDILWLHTISDAVVALAYYSIPAALFVFVRRRKDLEFRWMFVAFALFIFACGTTHAMSIVTTWNAAYFLEGLIKAGTALISVATAILLWPLLPKALALPSPAELERVNAALQAEVEERSRAEARVRQLNEELEKRVEARTAELEQEVEERRKAEGSLRGVAHALDASREELERFAYVAAHDLRAPLQAIRNLVQWLQEDLDGRLDPEPRRMLDLVAGRADRLDALLAGLLAYSRAGRIEADVEEVDLADLIDEVIADVPVRDSIEVRREGRTRSLSACRVPLRQVLANLVSNAVQHHRLEGGSVVVRVADGEEGTIRIEVEDDGPGIPEEHRERVFEMFRRLQPRDRVEGSGIGLALVRKIVESFGGEVKLESSVGEGTLASFTWPTTWDRSAGSDRSGRSK